MRAEIIQKINDLNREFYQNFADSFSRTRGRIQPGVRQILEKLTHSGYWLDIGCGNGNLARELARSGREVNYLGIDGSAELVRVAENSLANTKTNDNLTIHFLYQDIIRSGWQDTLPEMDWTCAFLFAVLHHIPGETERLQLCREIHDLLIEEGKLYVSVWQVNNSPRMLKRVQSWEAIGLVEKDVDTGDVLMDWRGENAEGSKRIGLRYVHVFTMDELTNLAGRSGFRVDDQFYSDGKEGNLGFYQVWTRN